MASWLGLEAYAGFVLGSYGITLLVVGVLVAWVMLDNRALNRTLRDLESSGTRRRSDRGASGGAGQTGGSAR